MIEKQIKETIERVYGRKFPTHKELKDIDYLTELITKLFTEQLHKPDVSGSVCPVCDDKGWYLVDEWIGGLQGRKDCRCKGQNCSITGKHINSATQQIAKTQLITLLVAGKRWSIKTSKNTWSKFIN